MMVYSAYRIVYYIILYYSTASIHRSEVVLEVEFMVCYFVDSETRTNFLHPSQLYTALHYYTTQHYTTTQHYYTAQHSTTLLHSTALHYYTTLLTALQNRIFAL